MNGRRRRSWGLALLFFASAAAAQQSFDTTSVAPERFVAAHGRKAVVMGYASGGLELWVYPLQIANGYRLGFRSKGDASETDGSPLLRRVTYDPEGITRTYIGPDYIVRERIFVPLEQPAMRFTYSVESPHTVDIVVHFDPVLDLMWPGSIGGQSVHWAASASAYELLDGTQQHSAWIGSADIVSHDEVLNSTQPGAAANQISFVLRPKPNATVVVTTDQGLLVSGAGWEAEARSHYDKLAAGTLHIETPDRGLNQQIAWAEVALDQAWVCNPTLGCGMVAGYGASRRGRRPQYAWFFAGDGLIATDALVSAGEYSRAQEELSFIARFQNQNNGMIWHELSQSAGPDWATQYPYMFVHVDITFQYLATVERYVAASGDTRYVDQHWQGLEAAYVYCKTLLNSADGLPRIPSSKLGGDEQDKMTDDASLSASWVAASTAFSRLARIHGSVTEAEEAAHLSEQARKSAASRYWDARQAAWIDGYTEAGRPIIRRGANGISLVSGHILEPQQSDVILNRVAAADFQTDWGTRGVAASSSEYDPSSYAKGSVSAASTAHVASLYWEQHRPFTAFPIWSAIVPWGTLDSMGHMHEVLAGDFFHQQIESVPEQTWSSAEFLSAAVHGLLGLEQKATDNEIDFSPHLPAQWNEVSVSNIPVKEGTLALHVERIPEGLELEADNTGQPARFSFAPEIAFGAVLTGATLDGKPIKVNREEHSQDTHAGLTFVLRSGKSRCRVLYQGGVELAVDDPVPLVGAASHVVKIVSISRQDGRLEIEADVASPGSLIRLRSSRAPRQLQGAKLQAAFGPWYELAMEPPVKGVYERRKVTAVF